jgi:hypothetical protein
VVTKLPTRKAAAPSTQPVISGRSGISSGTGRARATQNEECSGGGREENDERVSQHVVAEWPAVADEPEQESAGDHQAIPPDQNVLQMHDTAHCSSLPGLTWQSMQQVDALALWMNPRVKPGYDGGSRSRT